MKKFLKSLGAIIIGLSVGLLSLPFNMASATSQKIYVNLEDLSTLTEYKTLAEFLEVYQAGNLPDVYVTDFLFDGVSSVKTPDLDDFIEGESNSTKIKTLEIKVININTTGDVEFTGKVTGAMIAVNTNEKKSDINIILNNASVDTDSKKAPAIYVYNKDKNYTDTKVTIKTVAGTENYLEGGKLKKVSLIGTDELSQYAKYYSGEALENYNNYSTYYGIYNSGEIKNVWFATVQADNEDLADGDPYYFYKASGAVSADIDLYFEGEGYLKIVSKNKEGVETKGNLTFAGGTGDYEIYAYDDCLNTTTATSINGETVRNDMVINVGTLTATVAEDADEGDAIDSNGMLTIDGGTIYAFAHPSSPDAGLDSGKGTYINGGTVIATGNMTDQISNDSKQKFVYVNFGQQVSAGELVTIKNSAGGTLMSFRSERTIKNLLYSSADVEDGTYEVYVGDVPMAVGNVLAIMLGVEAGVLVLVLGGYYISYKRK